MSGPIFFSPGDTHTKASLVLLHPGFERITVVDADPKGGFVSFKVTPLALKIDFSVLMPLQNIYSTREQLARGRFFKGLQIYMENKYVTNKTKYYLEALVVLWIKKTSMVEIKHKDFIDAVPIMPSLWIMTWGSMERENPDSPEFTRYGSCFGKDPG